LLHALPATQLLLWVAAGTILLASLIAMTKDNLKARLAYSTVSQLAYVTLGALLATSSGIVGGSMHIAMHAFGKITLFFCAGAVLVAAHKSEISDMRGIGRALPLTMACFFIGALSIIGLPFAGGAWSKWYLAMGALEAGQVALVAVLMVSSLLSAGYLLVIPVRAFFSPPSATTESVHGAPAACSIAIAITALGTIALFLFPGPLLQLTSMIGQP
jgi:multicomponent Na+:H+ antiporter subunit D